MDLSERDYRVYFQHYFPRLRPRENGEASVPCPFHDDKNPSLSLNVRRGIWHCLAGCGGGGIVAFEQQKNGGTPQEAWKRVAQIIGKSLDGGPPEPTTIYDYADETGKLSYQVVRLPGKKFRQRRPDGKGGWEWNLKGVRRVPYRLQELVKADQVFIPEGEKDVETLRTLGLTATTNAMGAGKWRPEFADYFKGKAVVIVPDNDEPGRKHTEQVAANLAPVARSVKVVTLPGLEEHQDVSDWLAKGSENTLVKLLSLVEQAQPWTTPADGEASSPAKHGRAGEPKPLALLLPQVELADGRVAEIVSSPDGSGTRFCLFRPGLQEVSFETQINEPGKVIKPTANEWAKAGVFFLATAPSFSEDTPLEIFASLCAYLERWFQGERGLIFLSVLYAILSWRIGQVSEIPYLRVLGEPGSGKSRWLTLMSKVCYRGFSPAVDITESSLFRLLKAVPEGTLAIDEADRKTGLDDPVTQVLRAGMERGRYVWRSDPTGVGQAHEPQPFPCFGPKLLAAARLFRDDALESRIFSFSLPLRQPPEHIPANVTAELDAEAQGLRNRLLAYHITTYLEADAFRGQMRKAATKLRDEHLEGRAIQIGTGLIAIAEEVSFTPATEACMEALRQHSEGISQGRRETIEGVILEVFEGLRGDGKTEIPLDELHYLVCKQGEERGLTRTNADGSTRPPIRAQGLSRMLRKQGKRFGVYVEPRLHGSDQPIVHLGKI